MEYGIANVVRACIVVGLMFDIGCATRDTRDNYLAEKMGVITRAAVEEMDDDDLGQIMVPEDAMENARRMRGMQIGVAVDFVENLQGRARPTSVDKLLELFGARSRSALAEVMPCVVATTDNAASGRKSGTGGAVSCASYPFLCSIKIFLAAETTAYITMDELTCRCQLSWELIDNRTRANGLGVLSEPAVIDSGACSDSCVRMLPLVPTGVSSDDGKVRSVWMDVILRCILQFRGQLARRFPSCGTVSGMMMRGDDVHCVIKTHGNRRFIRNPMQMLVVDENLGHMAVGEVISSSGDKCVVKIWRWISRAHRGQIESLMTKDKAEIERWLDKHSLCAVSLGLPDDPKDERLDFRRGK